MTKFKLYDSIKFTNKASIPRIAIRMQEDGIGEVRGVADNEQNLEGNMIDIAEAKMKELPGAESYRKKSADMKRLTEIDNKTKQNTALTKDDLIFLYEINSPIEGFGYQRDPRLEEILAIRNPKEDAPIALECEPNEIAYGQEEYELAIKENRNIKAYVGPLFPNIFLQNLEYIYTKFPTGRIEQGETAIGGKSKEEIIAELESRAASNNPAEKIYLSSAARSMLQEPEFATLTKPENINLIKLTVSDLGFSSSATTDQIYQRAEELGLKLCPPEVGPQLRLNYEEVFKREQAKGEYLRIAMKTITVSYPYVFIVDRSDSGSRWLGSNLAKPENEWSLGDEFVFSRK